MCIIYAEGGEIKVRNCVAWVEDVVKMGIMNV